MRRSILIRLAPLAVGALVASAACGGSVKNGKTPTGARATCEADTDCVLTNRLGCCAACVDQPRAIPVSERVRQENKCAAVDCSAPSERIECPRVEPLDRYVAKCAAGTCAAVKR